MARRNRATDVQAIKQQIQQAEANKLRASGIFASNANSMQVEFGSETDFNEVRQQNSQAEMKKQQASGMFANKYRP